MNCVKMISELYKDCKVSLVKARKEGSKNLPAYENKMALLQEIVDYIKTYQWVKQQSVKEKVKTYLTNDYDYTIVCDVHKVSYDAARQTIKWACDQLEKKIGRNTILDLKENDIEGARASFYISMGKIKVKDLLLSELAEQLPDPQYGVFDLSDCTNELKILHMMSAARLDYFMGKIDMAKLAYVMYLLYGHSEVADYYRPYLIELMQNKISVNDMLDTAKPFEQDNPYVT